MIVLNDVHKRYWTSRGEPHWVLRGITLTFPRDKNVGIIGRNGAGKSTMLRLMAGLDVPTRGTIEAKARLSWPLGLTRGLQGTLTGRQNARFICRLYGYEGEELDERVATIHAFSELGEAFDEPVNNYSSGMRGRVNFSIAHSFQFEMYLADEGMGAGDETFKDKVKSALEQRFKRSSLVVVSHNERTIARFCEAAVWLNEGKAEWFDTVRGAFKAYRRMRRKSMGEDEGEGEEE
jgi:capsular polysaccharide transport system ATP-binding protein